MTVSVDMLRAGAPRKPGVWRVRSGKQPVRAFGGGSGGLTGRRKIGFAQVGAHDDEEFGEFEGFAEKKAGLQAHAMKLPVVAAGDDDDWGVTSAVMAAQDFIESGTVEIREADVKQNEMWMKRGYGVTGDLAVVEEGELPVREVFEGIMKKFGEFGVVFDDNDAPGGWTILLQ